MKTKKSTCWTYRLPSSDYRVAKLFILFLTVAGLKPLNNSNMLKSSIETIEKLKKSGSQAILVGKS